MDPGGTDTGGEWIELYNNGPATVNLKGYELYPDGIGYFTFPDISLTAGTFLVLHLRQAGVDTPTSLYFDTPANNMGNSAGSVAFFSSAAHSTATLVDFVQYGGKGQTWESAAVSAGLWQKDAWVTLPQEGGSFGLKVNGEDTNVVGDWTVFSRSSPGSDNQTWLKQEEQLKNGFSENLEILQSPFSPFGDGQYSEAVVGVNITAEYDISVKIFDTTGLCIRTLAENKRMQTDKELFIWNGKDDTGAVVPVGIYVVCLEAVHINSGEVKKSVKTVIVACRLE